VLSSRVCERLVKDVGVRFLAKAFEGLLWNSRLIVLAAVVASILGALGLFFMT
jgi:uncharacterized membrane protein YqhA